jgi:hypothetical protein
VTSTPTPVPHDAELGTAADKLRAHAAAMNPTAVTAVADWLGCMAMLDPAERGGDECGWCGVDHALTIARVLNANPTTA